MATIINTSKLQLDEVLTWLEQEQNDSCEGFYCNKEIIIDSFNACEMRCIKLNGLTVGFGIFNIKSISASIDILEIHPSYRGNGLGMQMAQHLLAHLFNSRVPYVSVKCTPKSSEKFWRKLGFIEYPDKYRHLREPLELKLTAERHNYSFKPPPLRGAI